MKKKKCLFINVYTMYVIQILVSLACLLKSLQQIGWKSGSPDTTLEGGHPRIISQKFGCNWPSGF